MKKVFIAFFIPLGLLLAFDYLFFRLTFASGREWIAIADFLVKSLLLFLLFINLLYNRAFSLRSGRIRIVVFIVFPLVLSMAIAHRLVAIGTFYHYAKTLPKIASGGIWQHDPFLSYRGVPLSKGSYDYYIGDSIEGSVPLSFDSNGFRTVFPPSSSTNDTADLYLGCSFTFGDFVAAEATYPFLTSHALGHPCINGALPGYGAGQMEYIAGSLLADRPLRYMFIQLSSWTVPRAMSLNGPTRFGYRPFPYYSDSSGSFAWNPPAYSNHAHVFGNWRKTGTSYWERIRFGLTDGFSIEVLDYTSWTLARCKLAFGFLPEPTKKQRRLEQEFYTRMTRLCKARNIIPVIVRISYPDSVAGNLPDTLRKLALFADADSALKSEAAGRGVPPEKLFRIYHRHGNDSIQFDAHPNPLAHRIIAATILQTISK